jgi:UDP-N-acetyl-D-glucosamine dehydrogenase
MNDSADFSFAAKALQERIETREALVCIVGLGYVGLPLAGAFDDAKFPVLGFDVDERKIELLGRGEDYMGHLGDGFSRELTKSGRFQATSDRTQIAKADAILLCVPTPLGEHNEPDLRYVLDSARLVAEVLRPGQLVVLESTTYPGTTRDEMLPILEASGLKCGEDFFVAYSPEREDPGRVGTSTSTIPKLVGGIDAVSGALATSLYDKVISQVHQVASAEIAEAAKLLENIYRAVNIALVNEMKVVLTEMNVDVWEVVKAAATKPFGFQAFYPGPGLGGHCIPIDPFYLTWKAKEIGHHTKFIELAGEINSNMPRYVVERVSLALNDRSRSLRGSSVLIIGIAYKPDIDDIRESPAAEIVELLQARGADVSYHDPLVAKFPSMRRYQIELDSVPLDRAVLTAADCVLIVTNHKVIDYRMIGEHADLVVDTRNAMAALDGVVKAQVVKA